MTDEVPQGQPTPIAEAPAPPAEATAPAAPPQPQAAPARRVVTLPGQSPADRGAPQVGPPRTGPDGRGTGGGYNDRNPAERKPFPKGERPRDDGTKPVALDNRDFGLLKPNTKLLDQGLEAEMAAALEGFDISGTVAQAETRQRQKAITPGTSQKKRGKILGVHGKDVFIDVPGGRGQGVLPLLQFTEEGGPVVGSEVEFDIERYDAQNGLLVLTRQGAAQVITDWSSIARGMVVEAKVTGINKTGTGLTVEVNGIKGFMPVSQIDMYRVEKAEDYVNQKLKCVVTELDPSERNLILSRRALLERERQEQAEQFWATIEEGQVRTGIVRSLKPFGAFVDLGGADGLIPVGEMSWSRVGDPSEVVQIGQKVEVVVQRLDTEARKIGLSLRQTVKSPWDEFAESHKPGTRLNGKVTRIAEFGAFVEVAPGVEGLIHISELGTLRVRRVRDAVAEGQDVTVQVMSVDAAARRMSLSLKALATEAEAAQNAVEASEQATGLAETNARLAARKPNPNLRGGIGAGKPLFGDVE